MMETEVPPATDGAIARSRGVGGFSLVELLVTMLVVAVVSLLVGPGLVKLLALEDLNREKARTLEAICVRHARTQPLVAVGAIALPCTNAVVTVGEDGTAVTNFCEVEGRIDIKYPYMVYGIACETNYLIQVTNTTVEVRGDDTLQTVIMSGESRQDNTRTNAMPWIDDLVPSNKMSKTSVDPGKGIVNLSYGYRIWVKGEESDLRLSVPVRMRNTAYVGYPDD